jgi:hypothetical protein
LNCLLHSCTGQFLTPSPRAIMPPVLSCVSIYPAFHAVRSGHKPCANDQVKETLNWYEAAEFELNRPQHCQLNDTANSAPRSPELVVYRTTNDAARESKLTHPGKARELRRLAA